MDIDSTIQIILTAIATFAAGGWWVNRRAAKDKARYEADNAGIEGLKAAIQTLEQDNKHLKGQNEEREAAIQALREKQETLTNDVARLKNLA